MIDCPKRSAVINQEATDKLLDNKKHHTSAQIPQAKQVAAITSAVFEAKKVNVAAQQKQHVAAFEDQLCKEDQQNEKNMAHPDLLMVPTHHVVTALSHLLDTESSDGRGLGFEDESDGDHEKDDNYVMDPDDGKNGLVSNSDEEIEVREVPKAAKKLGKAKGDKVSLFPLSLCLGWP